MGPTLELCTNYFQNCVDLFENPCYYNSTGANRISDRSAVGNQAHDDYSLRGSLELNLHWANVKTASYLKIAMAVPGGATHLKVDGRVSVYKIRKS